MDESNNTKTKKGLISEDDVALVLRRYNAPTVLAVLREVAQFPDVKIDWNALVKKTSTGISNAREYQMLWRHLAYCDMLGEKVEEAEPLDDDSDLEYELEAFPPVSDEASVEAAACVKVMLASGLPDDSGPPNRATVEAPLTINIPNGQATRDPSDNPQPSCSKGTNITVSVSVQKQPLPTVTTAEGLDGSGSAAGGLPARRKRKPWTLEEDMELIAAVQKCGERNWANILKGDFKGERTASQLSQRWSIIRKRQANSNPGGVSNPTGSQLSETQLATRNALSLALNMPEYSSLSAVGATNLVTPAVPAASTEAAVVSGAPLEANTKSTASNIVSHQNQQAPLQTATSLPKATSNTTATKSRVTTKKPTSFPVKSPVGPNPMIQAAAVAAGARIATPSTAKSHLKAAQSKNAVHIRPGGNPLIKPSVPGGTKPVAPRPNVHYIRTGLTSASPPASTYSTVVPSILPPPAVTAQVPSVSAHTSASCGTPAEGKSTNVITTGGVGSSSKEEEVKPAEEMNVDCAADVVQDSGQGDQAALPDTEMVTENPTAENLGNSSKVVADENVPMDVDNNQIESETAKKMNSPAAN
ncbi:SANT/Myb domain [Macleaya cordata]|uniref:SANT/Myb domain n=1 Tax=Macleaya cordata TaxID=56857 RepID=A0A200PUI2_MACCD|nr:SANT/Myb domain [Macleaya cordata]